MKNMNAKTKKWLAVAGCLALCAVLVVLIGQQFKSEKPSDNSLPPQSSEAGDVTVNPNEPDTAEKEKEIVITPPDASQQADADNGAVSSGTEQTIQSDAAKPEYTEDQLIDPTQKPNGEKVTEPPKAIDHDKVEVPKEPASKPSSGNSIPGFDNVPDGGANTVIEVDGDGDINKQVGNMGN